MDNEQLRDSLEQLRAEINQTGADGQEARRKLNDLISDIEHGLDNPDDHEHRATVVASMNDAIAQFEVEHPRATGILNHIMVTLSNMGI